MSKDHFLFSSEQLELQDHFSKLLNTEISMAEVRRVFEGEEAFHSGLWQKMAAQGWLGLITDEQYGGSGLGMLDLCLLGLEIGAKLAALPFLGHLCMATRAVSSLGSESSKQAYLGKFSEGALLATMAYREPQQADWRDAPLAKVKGDRLTAVKTAVNNGYCADIAIVSAQDEANKLALYIAHLDSPTVSKTTAKTIDPASNFATLKFDDTPVQRLHESELSQQAFEKIIYEATIVNAFVQLSSAESAFEMARSYALERVAFGRQIGSFQAIKHKLARMYESLSIARANCYFGAWAIRENSSLLGLAAASSHTAACESFNQCARDNNKIHGGISATWTSDCHLFYRRAKLSSVLLGSQFLWDRILTENLAANKADLSADFSSSRSRESLQRLRQECRSWINENRPPLDDLYKLTDDEKFQVILNWHKTKAKAGWACLHWPKKYGGKAWSPEKRAIWHQEEGETLRDLCFPLAIIDIAGAVLMTRASQEQQDRYLPKILSGEEFWCQLFSEPQGGSDVAALRTRAVKDGDEWIINGQKIWTSNADHSDFGMLIARTDPTVAKHKGLTYFILDMNSPGVEIRPLKQIDGDAGFCQVFFDDVHIPDANRIGEVDGGWSIVMTTLASEKVALQSFQIYLEKYLDTLESIDTDGQNALSHPFVHRKTRAFNNKSWALKFIELQSMYKSMKQEQPGPEESINKLIVASANLEMASFVIDMYDSQCFDPDKPENLKFFEHIYLHFVGVSMGGGTEEILLNLIGDQFLGLPPEPRVDKGIPFNQLKFGTQPES